MAFDAEHRKDGTEDFVGVDGHRGFHVVEEGGAASPHPVDPPRSSGETSWSLAGPHVLHEDVGRSAGTAPTVPRSYLIRCVGGPARRSASAPAQLRRDVS